MDEGDYADSSPRWKIIGLIMPTSWLIMFRAFDFNAHRQCPVPVIDIVCEYDRIFFRFLLFISVPLLVSALFSLQKPLCFIFAFVPINLGHVSGVFYSQTAWRIYDKFILFYLVDWAHNGLSHWWPEQPSMCAPNANTRTNNRTSHLIESRPVNLRLFHLPSPVAWLLSILMAVTNSDCCYSYFQNFLQTTYQFVWRHVCVVCTPRFDYLLLFYFSLFAALLAWSPFALPTLLHHSRRNTGIDTTEDGFDLFQWSINQVCVEWTEHGWI